MYSYTQIFIALKLIAHVMFEEAYCTTTEQ